MSDRTLSVRQIAQYPLAAPMLSDLLLVQQGGLGGAYASATVAGLFASYFGDPLSQAVVGNIFLSPAGVIGWGTDPGSNMLYGSALRGALAFSPDAGWRFDYVDPSVAVTLARITPAGSIELPFGTVRVARPPGDPSEVVTLGFLTSCVVTSFNARRGDICLAEPDVLCALGITPPDGVASRFAVDRAISTALNQFYWSQAFVFTFNGRRGNVTLTADDVTSALLLPGHYAYANSPALGDASGRLATTLFVDETASDIEQRLRSELDEAIDHTVYALLDSPHFLGIPTAPTANPGTSTGQLATTAFVMAAVTASTTGVASFNTRTGAIVLYAADITGAGGALLASPIFTGVPSGPTASPGTSSAQFATTAFVTDAVAASTAGVASFNTRTGDVTLYAADITGVGGALLASPALTGTPTAPTAAQTSNDTTIATTAFVQAALTAGVGVASFNGRLGAVTLAAADVSAAGGALVLNPTFMGIPSGPTAAAGTSTTQLATTAFVMTQLTAGAVVSFNGRSGTVTLSAADITGAGGALLASPALTGVPTAPTAAAGTSTTQIATTAFVSNRGNAGVTNGTEAPAGQVGEYVQVTNLGLTSVPSDYVVCRATLPAGDWDVFAWCTLNASGYAASNPPDSNINTELARTDVSPWVQVSTMENFPVRYSNSVTSAFVVGPLRCLGASAMSVQISAVANFPPGAASYLINSGIRARRMR